MLSGNPNSPNIISYRACIDSLPEWPHTPCRGRKDNLFKPTTLVILNFELALGDSSVFQTRVVKYFYQYALLKTWAEHCNLYKERSSIP